MGAGKTNIGGGGLGNFFGDGSDGTIPNLALVTTAPNGGTVANLWDMSTFYTFTTNTLPAASDHVIFNIDFGTPQLLGPSGYTAFSAAIMRLSTGANRNAQLEWSDDNIAWNALAASAVSTSSVTVNLVGHANPHRHWRLVLKAGGSDCTLFINSVILNKLTTDTFTTTVWNIVLPSTLNGAAVVKQYADFNLPAGYTITVQNPNQGLIIYSQNDIVNAGVLDMSQKAGLAPNGNAIPMLITKSAYKTAKTSSLLHFDNNITDAQGKVWTNNGAATFDAANKKFGTHAISFNGTNQWIDTPASDDFSFGSDDFTIDFWVRPTSINTRKVIITDYSISFGSSVYVDINDTNVIRANINGTGLLSSTTVISANTWYHVSLIRCDSKLKLYINGIEEASILHPISKRTTSKLTIGREGENAGYYFAGQIDEFRIIKGKAMYTANFTPPVAEYTYQATYIDTPKTLEKYFQLTNVLQTLRGGYGGNGGYGGGYSGATGRQSSVGIGGAGRQNLGGFGGGGSGGSTTTGTAIGGIGGSVSESEIGGGKIIAPESGSASCYGINGVNGAGAIGAIGSSASWSYMNDSGKCNGAGGGATGAIGISGGSVSVISGGDGQYSGGFVMLIAKNNITNVGTIKANGGAGGNGSAGQQNIYNVGGGGGGGGAGGGVIAIFYGNAYTNTGTVQVNGGAGGTGGAGNGGEAGGAGTSGSVGTIHIQQL